MPADYLSNRIRPWHRWSASSQSRPSGTALRHTGKTHTHTHTHKTQWLRWVPTRKMTFSAYQVLNCQLLFSTRWWVVRGGWWGGGGAASVGHDEPFAVSPESITASAPSSTALATSLTCWRRNVRRTSFGWKQAATNEKCSVGVGEGGRGVSRNADVSSPQRVSVAGC